MDRIWILSHDIENIPIITQLHDGQSPDVGIFFP